MKHTFYLLVILMLCGIQNKLYATPQVSDLLIYKGDTLWLFAYPLEALYKDNMSRPDFWNGQEACIHTGCWRGYKAEWKIENNTLYLTNIYSCCYYEDGIKADLRKLFGNKCVDGKVKADWYTGNALVPRGKLVYDMGYGDGSVYETELEFRFNRGRLTGIETFDNSRTKMSEYSQNQEKLNEFIYSNINWDSLPPVEDNNSIRVIVQFYSNEDGSINAKVIKGYNDVFDKEALRVIRSLPEWDIIIQRGKHVKIPWNYRITFNEKNKSKNKDK